MEDSFKVIVVGGGPIGLTAAYALHLAGINYVIFERRATIVEDKGASLVLYPHTFRKVIEIETNDSGVKVSCAEGTTFSGSMVIGADGVYSKTCRPMRKLALDDDPLRQWDSETPFTSTYRLIFGYFPMPAPEG
jgi:2-polyprenyl-6-methoxyphenol hydroxylase-like FAD-dependent oxidoreductase